MPRAGKLAAEEEARNMFKPMMAALISQVVAIVALAVCLGVAVASAAFCIYEALRLVLPSYAASGLLALVFLLISAGLVAWLRKSQQEKALQAPPKFGLRLLRDLAMAGAVTFISAAGVRPRR